VAEHNPFEAILPGLAKRIDELILMRNFLAHYSGYSRRAYCNHMGKAHGYARVPEPGAFLIRRVHNPSTYRWHAYLILLLAVSEAMRLRVA